jgi:hypothetical protein
MCKAGRESTRIGDSTPVSSTSKTGRFDIAEIFLKMELKTMKSTQIYTTIRQSKLRNKLKE